MKLDIERLIDIVDEENTYYTDYKLKAKNLYTQSLDGLEEHKQSLSYAYQCHDRAQSATQAVTEVLQLDKEQCRRLYIATRAVIRWRKRTNYAYLIPNTMKDSIERFIFA